METLVLNSNNINLFENVRFRAYDEKKKIKLTVYNDFSKTLLKYRFTYSTVLMIEVKTSE